MKKFLKLLSRFAIANFAIFSSAIYFAPAPVSPQQPTPVPTPVPSAVPTILPTPKVLPLSSHNTRNNCWVSFQGQIYNITPYLGLHPGGDGPISKYCGKDMTSAFDSKDKSPAVPHSQAAKSMLQQYLVK